MRMQYMDNIGDPIYSSRYYGECPKIDAFDCLPEREPRMTHVMYKSDGSTLLTIEAIPPEIGFAGHNGVVRVTEYS